VILILNPANLKGAEVSQKKALIVECFGSD